MGEQFLNGWIVDAAIALMLLEAAALSVFAARDRRAGLLANVAAGACLMLALRAAIAGSDWPWVALAMLGALAGHVVDVALRLRLPGGNRPKATGGSLHPR